MGVCVCVCVLQLILHPTPYILHDNTIRQSWTLHPAPHNPTLFTLHPLGADADGSGYIGFEEFCKMHGNQVEPRPQILNLNPNPQRPNRKPYTLHPAASELEGAVKGDRGRGNHHYPRKAGVVAIVLIVCFTHARESVRSCHSV